MFSAPDPQENRQSDEIEVTLTDAAGRSLSCTMEYAMQVENREYLLLLPIDLPVEIFTWGPEDIEQPTIPVEDEAEIDRIFDTAKVVLSEQFLILKRTAVTLTVEGELPDWEEEDLQEPGEDDEDVSYYEELATFTESDRKYAICTPLEPFLIPAKKEPNGKLELLSEKEFEEIEPTLQYMFEEEIFDELE